MLRVDPGEKEIIQYCKDNEIEIVIEELRVDGTRVCDISNVGETFFLERKKKDIWNITHLQEQLDKYHYLTEAGFHVAVVFEGDYNDLNVFFEEIMDVYVKYLIECKRNGIKPKQAPSKEWGKSVLAKAFMFDWIPFLPLGSIENIVQFAMSLDRVGDPQHQERLKPKIRGYDEHMSILCQIDLIGPVLARSLLAKFGTPLRIFIADDAELLAIPKMGPKKIAAIRRAVE